MAFVLTCLLTSEIGEYARSVLTVSTNSLYCRKFHYPKIFFSGLRNHTCERTYIWKSFSRLFVSFTLERYRVLIVVSIVLISFSNRLGNLLCEQCFRFVMNSEF